MGGVLESDFGHHSDLPPKASQRVRERAFWVERATHAKDLKKEGMWYVLKTKRRWADLVIKGTVLRSQTKRQGLDNVGFYGPW